MSQLSPPIAPQLSHLDETSLDELYRRYLGGERIADLLKAFHVDCSPSTLIKLLPPDVLADALCPSCNVPMHRAKRSRTQQKSGEVVVPHCPKCKHFEGKKRWRECRCDYCKGVIHRLAEEERRMIHELYGIELRKPVHFDKLTLREKVVLFALLRSLGDKRLTKIQSLADACVDQLAPLTLEPEAGHKLQIELYKKKIILVDPDSPIDAFDKAKAYEEFSASSVAWIPNIVLTGELQRLSARELFNQLADYLRDAVNEVNHGDLANLMLEVSTYECLAALKYWSNEYHFRYQAGPKTLRAIEELLEKYSVSNVRYLLRKAVEEASLYHERQPNVLRAQAYNIIPKKLIDYGKRAVSWDLRNFPRLNSMPRCQLSRVIFDHIMGGHDAGFTTLIVELLPSVSTESTDWACDECGGHLSHPQLTTTGVRLVCVGCGFASLVTGKY